MKKLTGIIIFCGFVSGVVAGGMEVRPNIDLAIGIYVPRGRCFGHEGVKTALLQNGFDNVEFFQELEPGMFMDYDVIFVPSVMTYSSSRRANLDEVRENQRLFAESGGGLIIVHESIGWRGPFKDNPVFPEIGRGVALDGAELFAPIRGVPLLVVDKDHPLAVDLPEEVEYAYDFPPLNAGPEGRVLLKPPPGAVARKVELDENIAGVISGEHGKGRVVLIGVLVGLAGGNAEVPPSGAELQLLLNSIRWAAGKEL